MPWQWQLLVKKVAKYSLSFGYLCYNLLTFLTSKQQYLNPNGGSTAYIIRYFCITSFP